LLVSLRATLEVSPPNGLNPELLPDPIAGPAAEAAFEVVDVGCHEAGCEVGMHCGLLS
jgi:hypothetical protein